MYLDLLSLKPHFIANCELIRLDVVQYLFACTSCLSEELLWHQCQGGVGVEGTYQLEGSRRHGPGGIVKLGV
jgi:hypothetical protein